MNDLYTEASVKKKVTAMDTFIKVITVLVVALLLAAGFFLGQTILGFLGALGLVFAYYLIPRLSVVYEYVFCDGQLDFDKIMAGEKRKHMYRLDFEQVLIMAPANSHALDSYKSNPAAKKLDFTSLEKDRKVYCIVESSGDIQTLVYFEPNEKMISYIKQKAPRKVSEY
ncbi:MAG: hypothetical protein IJ427_00555 [Lachnospiraceae bacterium]|nr:hypothetical protein [Lachnospiraceae bacterium]MBQ8546965.1 hypothetical protein [Lachnospiraceae bacterium]